MIDEKETKNRYGYNSLELASNSGKKVVYICPGCGKRGETEWRRYLDDHKCISCSQKGKHHVGKQKIVEDIRRLINELGRQPNTSDYEKFGKYRLPTVRRNFGGMSWKEILVSLGYVAQRQDNEAFTFEDVCKDMQRLEKEMGRIPNYRDYRDNGEIDLSVVYRVGKLKGLNTYSEVVTFIFNLGGEDPNFFKRGRKKFQRKEYYLEELKKLASQLGHTPTSEEANKHGKLAARLLNRIRGGWGAVVKEAGLDINKLSKKSRSRWVNDEDIIRDIKRLSIVLKRTPGREDYREKGKYGLGTVLRRFDGSWTKAVRAAGLQPYREKCSPAC